MIINTHLFRILNGTLTISYPWCHREETILSLNTVAPLLVESGTTPPALWTMGEELSMWEWLMAKNESFSRETLQSCCLLIPDQFSLLVHGDLSFQLSFETQYNWEKAGITFRCSRFKLMTLILCRWGGYWSSWWLEWRHTDGTDLLLLLLEMSDFCGFDVNKKDTGPSVAAWSSQGGGLHTGVWPCGCPCPPYSAGQNKEELMGAERPVTGSHFLHSSYLHSAQNAHKQVKDTLALCVRAKLRGGR